MARPFRLGISALSSGFYAPSAAAPTPNTELSVSGTGIGADANG